MGSPRKNGNTATIVKHFNEKAEELGANTKVYNLNSLNYKGCQACMICKTKSDKCALEDDLTEILEDLRDTDVVVMASPVYYGDVTSQLKAFIDRTYSYLVPDFKNAAKPCRLESGKKMVFIMPQGNPDENLFVDIFPKYKMFFQYYGMKDFYLIRACGVYHVGDVDSKEDVLKLAKETAEKVMG